MEKWQIGWGTIARCNMKCEFCYSENTRSELKELKLNDWKKFVDENHNFIETINYGTGENTLDLEWLKLVCYIRKEYPEIVQAVTTNGYLSELAKSNSQNYNEIINSIDEVDVSLDFADENTHNSFRGQKHAFKWAINTLDFCKHNNIPATIVFLGTDRTLNEENLQGLFEIAKKYGSKLRMNIYRPTSGINDFTNKFIASFDKIVNALSWINDNHKILSISDPLFSAILTNDNFEEDPSGTNSLRILSDGSITPSTYLIDEDFRVADIKDKEVLKSVSKKKYFEEISRQIVPEDCHKCNFSTNCKGGVYDRRYLWYKKFEEKDPYCPYRENNFLPKNKLTITKQDDFSSVHHGYLPTMFFTYA